MHHHHGGVGGGIGRGANDGDEDKTLAEAHNAPNDDGHPDTLDRR